MILKNLLICAPPHVPNIQQEDAIDLHERIDSAIASRDTESLSEACEELKEPLFFVEDQLSKENFEFIS